MPATRVVYFKDADGIIPVKEWLDNFVARNNIKALIKCKARLKYLSNFGLECRRPYADYLRNGIYELRAEHGNINYRILYFFSGKTAAVAAVGLVKESRVPDKDIDLAVARKAVFESDPERYTYYEPEEISQ